MVQSLTDWLQQNRLIVVAVNPDTRRVSRQGRRRRLHRSLLREQTVVVTDEDRRRKPRRAECGRHRAVEAEGRDSPSASSSSAACGRS